MEARSIALDMMALGTVLFIIVGSIALAASDKASTSSLDQWVYKKIYQIDCRLNKLEGKQPGDATCP